VLNSDRLALFLVVNQSIKSVAEFSHFVTVGTSLGRKRLQLIRGLILSDFNDLARKLKKSVPFHYSTLPLEVLVGIHIVSCLDSSDGGTFQDKVGLMESVEHSLAVRFKR